MITEVLFMMILDNFCNKDMQNYSAKKDLITSLLTRFKFANLDEFYDPDDYHAD